MTISTTIKNQKQGSINLSVEELPSWIYTFLILPILALFQRQFSIKSRVAVLESNQKIYIEKVKQMCKSTDDLTKEVHEMIGEWKEHRRKTD